MATGNVLCIVLFILPSHHICYGFIKPSMLSFTTTTNSKITENETLITNPKTLMHLFPS